MTKSNYKLEEHVNERVKSQFEKLGLKNQKDYHIESAMPDYLIKAWGVVQKLKVKQTFANLILA